MSNLIGQTLGPYRLISQIGAGGMATVYKAYQPSMDRYVAIKVLPPYLSQDEQFARRFQREAKAVAKLEHAHILPVHDYGEAEGITYLVMRFVEGGTLKQRITQGTPSLSEVVRLMGQIGDALDYAHRLGVIHRDVKPANVLIDGQGNTYLTDFGLARMMEASDQLTASGVGVGTPAYMSPEQGQGVKVDHRSDIYSLGVVLYEMVTGHVPYEAETPMAVMLKHITEPLPLPRSINPNVPEPVERVILKALAKDPAHRYQTAGEMVEALTIATRNLTKEPEQPVEGKLGIAGSGIGRERISLLTRLQRTWAQPRGKVWLVGGTVVVLVALGLLLSRLPGQVQITNEQLSVARSEATATSAAGTAAPTATSAPAQAAQPAPAAVPGAPCRVAYVDKTSSDAADIFVQDCDGSNSRRVTEGRVSTGHEPAWAPDGQRLVFDEMQAPYDPNVYVPTYLYIVNADSSNRIPITAPEGPVEGNFPSWSPDGARIAWQRGCEIMTIRPDGSDMVTVLAHHELSGAGDPEMCVHRPMWSPDSRQFAFATFPLEAAWDPSIPGPYEYRFYVVNADGTGLIKLVTFMLEVRPMGVPVEAAWSADGKQVAFEMTVDDKPTIKRYLMRSDGSGEPVEIESIPESWRPWHWPQWGGEAQAATLAPQAGQTRAFTNPSDFEAAISGLGAPTVVDFEDMDAKPTNNTVKERKPFDGATYASRGIVFSSPYGTPLYIAPGGLWWNASNSLSVGQFPNDANARSEDTDDDVTITLDPPAVAVGFTLVDLVKREATHVAWLDTSGAVVAEIPLPNNYENEKYRAFVGIVSPNRPIATIRVDEGPPKDGDDVNYDDFSFIPLSTPASQTAQARAFAEPILTAIANRSPDYQDDLSDLSSGWPVATYAQGERSGEIGYKDGEYFLVANPASARYPAVHSWLQVPAPDVSDFVMEFDTRVISAGHGSIYVHFRVQEKNVYVADVAPDGRVRLATQTIKGDTLLAETQGSLPKLNELNRVRIIADGPRIALYLNDRAVLMADKEFTEWGGIILGIWNGSSTPMQVNFDNFKVWNISKQPVSALGPQAEQARAFAEPILQAIASRKPDVADDFSAVAQNWDCDGKPLQTTGECKVVDGVVRMTPVKGGFSDLSHPWQVAGSFVLMIDARQMSGSCASGFQFFLMGPDRWNNLHLSPCMNEASMHVGFGGQIHPELEGSGGSVRPIGETNHILVIARGPRFAFYLNDVLVAYFEESHLDAAHQIGFRCSALPEMVCEFDNVRFWNLDNVPGLP